MTIINLGKVDLDIKNLSLPYLTVKYSNPDFLKKRLPREIVDIFLFMSKGLLNPKWTYIFRHLKAGEKFGHGRFHKDGTGSKGETHRLLIYGGRPTLGIDGTELITGNLWEFSGDYLHKSQPVYSECDRLLLRVSNF